MKDIPRPGPLDNLFCLTDEYRPVRLPSNAVFLFVDDLCVIPLYSDGPPPGNVLLLWT
jgi:hypothetical protein